MLHPSKTLAARIALVLPSAAAVALLLAPAATQAKKTMVNRGLESIHQPVVERTDYVFDARVDGATLPLFEQGRLIGWFDAMNLGYGDRVAVVDGDMSNGSVRAAISDLVARYGLLLAQAAPTTTGRSGVGLVRIVLSRATAQVPGCPSWDDRSETDLNNRTGSNYGCAVNSNLAMMVADPLDLVEGRASRSDLRVATGSRAIRTYQEKVPTGAGDLKTETANGEGN